MEFVRVFRLHLISPARRRGFKGFVRVFREHCCLLRMADEVRPKRRSGHSISRLSACEGGGPRDSVDQ